MKSNFSSTEDKLFYLLLAQLEFLICTYQRKDFENYDRAVDFGFMLILLALLDIIFILFGKRPL